MPGGPPASIEPAWKFPRFAIGDLRFSFTRRKLVVSRAHRDKTVHLTISWGNGSGEIDCHLTCEGQSAGADSNRKEKAYTPLFRIRESDLEEGGMFLQRLFDQHLLLPMAQRVRRFRPGWLAHRGYVVALFTEEEGLDLLRHVAPKVKRRYRLDVSRFADEEQLARLHERYHAAWVLREITHGEFVAPIFAERIASRRFKPAQTLQLWHMAPPGRRPGWWGISQRDMERVKSSFLRVVEERLRPYLGDHCVAVFDKIVDGLALDDFADTWDVQRTRAFLSGRSSLFDPALPSIPA